MPTPLELYNQLADDGLSLDQAVRVTDALRNRMEYTPAHEYATKSAAGVYNVFSGLVSSGGKVLANASAPLVAAAILGPPTVGAAIGDLAARGADATKEDINHLQEQELITELMNNAEAIRRRRALREAKPTQA